MTSVVALPGPLRPEQRDELLRLYRRWVRTGRAELSHPVEDAGRHGGQNVRSVVGTSEKMKISVPPIDPT